MGPSRLPDHSSTALNLYAHVLLVVTRPTPHLSPSCTEIGSRVIVTYFLTGFVWRCTPVSSFPARLDVITDGQASLSSWVHAGFASGQLRTISSRASPPSFSEELSLASWPSPTSLPISKIKRPSSRKEPMACTGLPPFSSPIFSLVYRSSP